MILTNKLDSTDGSSCTLHYDETDGWLRAVWLGYIDQNEAQEAAQNFLDEQQGLRCSYLLNDNRGIRGPWFSSMDWLSQVWLPQVAQVGLRYVAHIPQPGDLAAEAAALYETTLPTNLDIQVFDELADAQQWLRDMGAAAA